MSLNKYNARKFHKTSGWFQLWTLWMNSTEELYKLTVRRLSKHQAATHVAAHPICFSSPPFQPCGHEAQKSKKILPRWQFPVCAKSTTWPREMISSEPCPSAKKSTTRKRVKPKLNCWLYYTDPWGRCGRQLLASPAYPHPHHLSGVCNNSVVPHYQSGSWQPIIKNMLLLWEPCERVFLQRKCLILTNMWCKIPFWSVWEGKVHWQVQSSSLKRLFERWGSDNPPITVLSKGTYINHMKPILCLNDCPQDNGESSFVVKKLWPKLCSLNYVCHLLYLNN